MAAVAALLRHGAGNSFPRLFRGLFVARSGSGVVRKRALGPLAGFAGRNSIASIDVVTAHDQNPLLKLNDNAQLPGKVAGIWLDCVARTDVSVHPRGEGSSPEKG
jgi:hypothetical protein